MQLRAGFTTGILFAAFVAAGGIAGPAMAQAQSPKVSAVNKVLVDNPQVLVGEST